MTKTFLKALRKDLRKDKKGFFENIVSWIIWISIIITVMVIAGLAYGAIKAQQASCKGFLCFG